MAHERYQVVVDDVGTFETVSISILVDGHEEKRGNVQSWVAKELERAYALGREHEAIDRGGVPRQESNE